MTTMASALLDFLLGLLRDPEAAAAFRANPDATLAANGLSTVCPDDVDAVMPVVLDYAPVTIDAPSSFDRSYDTGGNTSGLGPISGVAPAAGGTTGTTPAGDEDDYSRAVQQIENIVNNYSYTSTVDDRDTILDQSVNQNIWADGPVMQLFDNDAIVASGDGAAAAGDDAWVDNSTDNSTNVWAEDSKVSVGNTDNSQTVRDSYNDNSDNSVEDSHDVEDSYNDNSQDNDGTDLDGSVQDNDGVDVDGDVAIGNSVSDDDGVDNDGLIAVGNEDNDSATIEDNDVTVTDNVVAVGNEDNDDYSDNSDNSYTDESYTDKSDNSFTDESYTDKSDNSSTDNSENTYVDQSVEDSFNSEETTVIEDNELLSDNVVVTELPA